MKKRTGIDNEESINKIQQQLFILEKKIDVILTKILPIAVPKPSPQPVQPQNRGQAGGGNNFRERTMYKVICADCRKECEVPFKPSAGRPVYCKDCFSKRKAPNVFHKIPDNKPAQAGSGQAIHIDKPKAAEKKRPVQKKKPAAPRRKAKKK